MKAKLMARFRDVLGDEISISPGMRVADIKELVRRELIRRGESLSEVLVAVGGSYAPDDYVIGEDDEVVIFPPVSGG